MGRPFGRTGVTRRAALVIALALSCVCAATFGVIRLEADVVAARDAQSSLLVLRLDLMEARDVPWDAAPGSGVPPADARGELLDSVNGIRASLLRLDRGGELPNDRAVFRHFDAAAAALWAVYAGVRSGNSDAADAASGTAAVQTYAAVGAMESAARAYRARAEHTRVEAELGSGAVIALLFVAFSWFYVRAVRRRVRAEALAGDNARLLAERARLFGDVVDAAEEERRRIAADIHEGPMQQLAALALTLDRAAGSVTRGDTASIPELLADVRLRVAEQMVALRRMMVELRPPVLDQMGLEPALREYVAQLNLRLPARCEFYADLTVSRFPRAVETTFYRIAQEALANAAKHADARVIRVTLTGNRESARLMVEDDGVGFEVPPSSDLIRDGSLGLAALRERVERAGGMFRVTSWLGAGTVLEAVVPLAHVEWPEVATV